MKRKVGLFVVCGLVLPLAVTASAAAQGSVLVVDQPNPTQGQAITVTAGFGATAPSSNVDIRLSTRTGRLLTTTTVTSGRINATFAVPPDLAPGPYLLIANQTTNANGRPASFSPARTRIRVRAAVAGAVGGGGRPGLPDSPLGLLAVASALLLLATGVTFTARRALNRSPLGS